MATLLQYEDYFARYIGENDYTSLEEVATSLINDSIKEISSLYPLECNKKSTTLSISSEVADLPDDFDYSHADKIRVYRYSSTTKYEYKPVPLDEIDSYDTSDYVYTLDTENKRIKVPADADLSLDYYSIPDDLDENTDIFNFPVPQAISRYAAGQYWQSIEEDPDQAKINITIADNLIKQAIINNTQSKIYRSYKPYGGRNIGYTKK